MPIASVLERWYLSAANFDLLKDISRSNTPTLADPRHRTIKFFPIYRDRPTAVA